MTKVYLLCALLSLSIMSCTGIWNDGGGEMTEKYKATLRALGAVPVSELDRKFWGDEQGQTAYLKGERVDINGWLSPYWAKSSIFLTDAEKERLGIPKKPLTYSEFISLLDVDAYNKTKHPLQFAIMAFVLENMLTEGIEIVDPDGFIKVYDAGIGLEERALSLLKGHVNSDEVMRLYEKHGDTRLLDVFPVPRPEEEKYIEFLRTVAEKEPNRGWFALSLLYTMDKATYKVPFRDFMISKVRATDNSGARIAMYRALVEIEDEKSVEFLAESLLNDPVTESREAIIRAALAGNMCPKKLVDSVIQLAKGVGEEHKSVTVSRMVDQWRHSLREYLIWVKGNNLCDAETRTNAEGALELLKR